MTKSQRRWIHLGNSLALGTGLFFGMIKYFFKVETAWGITAHPAQSWGLYFHILLSPILIFAIGLIWNEHVWEKIKSKHKIMRKSGLTLALTFFVMCWSGYLLQTSVNQMMKQIMLVLHLSSSALWSFFFVFHYLKGRSDRRFSLLRNLPPWRRKLT